MEDTADINEHNPFFILSTRVKISWSQNSTYHWHGMILVN